MDPAMWQVIAGIAQLIAAVFAAITVWQAKQMLNQADHQVKQSVAPGLGYKLSHPIARI